MTSHTTLLASVTMVPLLVGCFVGWDLAWYVLLAIVGLALGCCANSSDETVNTGEHK